MALPSSGQISFSQLALELSNSCLNVSLRDYSACANLTSPDSIAELYGKVCTPAKVWSTGGSLITGRYNLGGAGTQNVGLAFGGYCAGYPTYEVMTSVTCTEEYNGTSWSAGGALITARCDLSGAGTQNAGLAIGGGYSTCTCTEEYNGTSWSTGGALIYPRFHTAGAGTQNEGLAAGSSYDGEYPDYSYNRTEEYNGTSWSTSNPIITARHSLAGAGTQNAGLAIGGGYSTCTCTEEYNGTSWSTGGALSAARYYLAGAGTQNAGLAFGGGTCTEEYNGTSWSTGGALSNARYCLAGAGTQNAGLAFGGKYGGMPLNDFCTEEYGPGGKCLA